jgi:hypothetical protein
MTRTQTPTALAYSALFALPLRQRPALICLRPVLYYTRTTHCSVQYLQVWCPWGWGCGLGHGAGAVPLVMLMLMVDGAVALPVLWSMGLGLWPWSCSWSVVMVKRMLSDDG